MNGHAELRVTPVGHFGGWYASINVPPGGGRYVYVGEGCGLSVVDVQDKARPILAGGLPLNGTDVTDIQFSSSGQIAYVANGAGLQVVSLEDPAKPRLLGSCATTGSANSVAVIEPAAPGGPVYVLVATTFDWTDGWIRIVDVSDPAHPGDVGGYDTAGSALHIVVAGKHAYVADGPEGLLILDLSTPTAPQFLGSYESSDEAQRVRVVGNAAYVADGEGGLHLLNVQNPATPVLLSTTEKDRMVRDVFVSGTVAYAVDGDSACLDVLNIAQPSNPSRLISMDLQWDVWTVVAAGSYAYVACGDKGLIVVNAQNPASPVVEGSYERLDEALAIATLGAYAYILDRSSLWACSITNPAVPVPVGKCNRGHTTDWEEPEPRLHVSGAVVAVADGGYGMPIFNIQDPANPSLAGRFAVPDGVMANDVFLTGQLACLLTLGEGTGRLRLINVANPANPVEIGGLNTPGDARRVRVLGQTAYVADGAGGLLIIDISFPSAPTEVGSIPPPDGKAAHAVAVAAHAITGAPQVYITFNDGTGSVLRAYDVANPAAPVLLGQYTSATEEFVDLDLQNGHIYAAGSLHVIDPATWQVVFSLLWQKGYVQDIQNYQVGDRRFVVLMIRSYGMAIFEIVDTGTLARIEMKPTFANLQLLGFLTFIAEGYDSLDRKVPIKNPVWTTSGGGTLSPSGTSCTYTATSAGNFTITCAQQEESIQGTATIIGRIIKVHAEYQVTTGRIVLTWAAIPGKVYDVYRTMDLANPMWQCVASGIPANPPQNTWSEAMSGGSAFYRLAER